MINTSETTISALIRAYWNSGDPDKAAAKHDLLMHYYGLSAAERVASRPEMQPFLAEIEQEMLAIDPFAQEVNDLLNSGSKC